MKAKTVVIATTCPNCGEAVEIHITKAEVKAMFKGFSLPIDQANLRIDEASKRNWNIGRRVEG